MKYKGRVRWRGSEIRKKEEKRKSEKKREIREKDKEREIEEEIVIGVNERGRGKTQFYRKSETTEKRD